MQVDSSAADEQMESGMDVLLSTIEQHDSSESASSNVTGQLHQEQ